MESRRQYFVYWIVSGHSCYIGATVDPSKRLRQHNGLVKGGARRTRGKQWHFHCVISGFRTWREALCFEWSFKYHSKHCRGTASRQLALDRLLAKDRWTSNSPLASEVPLTFAYSPTEYGYPSECEIVADAASTVPLLSGSCKHQGLVSNTKPPRREFNKKLYGVTY